jgi:hypothetical protein
LVEIHSHADEITLHYPIRYYNMLLSLAGMVQSADAGPTKQEGAILQDLRPKIDAHLTRLRSVEATDIGSFNALLKELNVPAIPGPPPVIVPERTAPTTMRAVVITRPGGPRCWRCRSVRRPNRSGAAARASSGPALNRADLLQREVGIRLPGRAPDIPGLEFAGMRPSATGRRRVERRARLGITAGGGHADSRR